MDCRRKPRSKACWLTDAETAAAPLFIKRPGALVDGRPAAKSTGRRDRSVGELAAAVQLASLRSDRGLPPDRVISSAATRGRCPFCLFRRRT